MTKLRLAPTLSDAIRAAAERHARACLAIDNDTSVPSWLQARRQSFEAGARWAMRQAKVNEVKDGQ